MKASLTPALLTVLLAALLPVSSRAESVIAQWDKIFHGPGNGWEAPAAVAVDGAGNVIVTGGSQGNIDPNRLWSIYILKYAPANGALLWQKRYNPSDPRGSSGSADLAVDGAGNVIITGSYHNESSNSGDLFTVKYAAANGALLWEKRFQGTGDDVATSLATDGEGNAIVTGYIYNTSGVADFDIYTAKYAAANGALLWEKRYDGPPGTSPSRDQAFDMAVDSAGNAIVTGFSRTTGASGAGRCYYTAKYAAADGAILWEKRYLGSGNLSAAYHVVVDSQDNAVVTGYSRNSDGSRDQYTAKYGAADGALLWEQSLPGPSGTQLEYSLLALDDGGNVIVGGAFHNSIGGGSNGPHAAKYSAANGVLLWEKRYNEPGVQFSSIAVEDAGNVIFTGRSAGSSSNGDIYTAIFAAADGALLWEKRYNGTGNLEDYGQAITVDNAGGIIVVGGINVPGDISNGDIYTVKYVPVDGDNDGLLDSWEVAHFGSSQGQSALDDTDGDGAVELLELAFGTNPRKPGASAAPAVVAEGGYLTTTIAKQPGVTYLVQSGGDPGAGFSAASTTLLTNTAGTLKVRDNFLMGSQPARFLRVQVTAAP